jgi:hypothetical protein
MLKFVTLEEAVGKVLKGYVEGHPYSGWDGMTLVFEDCWSFAHLEHDGEDSSVIAALDWTDGNPFGASDDQKRELLELGVITQ